MLGISKFSRMDISKKTLKKFSNKINVGLYV